MINKINANQIQDLAEQQSADKANAVKPSSKPQADASLQTEYASLLEKALTTPTDDADAVQRACDLLKSGQLDCPDNTREAAENIIEYGV